MRDFRTITPTSALDRELARIPVREPLRPPLQATTTNGGSSACGCCDCFNCNKNHLVAVGGCAGCKKAATEKYSVTIGNWVPWPDLGGTFELTYAGTGDDPVPCLWKSETICVSPIPNPDELEGCYQWWLDLSVLPSMSLVYISGDDVVEIGDFATLYQADNPWDCQCESKLMGIRPDTIDSTEGLQCTVCVVPNGTYQCCCNCFFIDWPGITVHGDSDYAQDLRDIGSAFEVQLIDIGYVDPGEDSVCDKYWELGDFTEPNPHYCRWAYRTTYPPFEELKPGFTLAVMDTYAAETETVTRVVTLHVGYGYPSGPGDPCNYASGMRYICKNFTCDGGTFVACADQLCTDTTVPGDGIDDAAIGSHGCAGDGPILDEPDAWVEYPATIEITAVACSDPPPPEPEECSEQLGSCCYEDGEGEHQCVEDTSECDCKDLHQGAGDPCWNDSHVDGHPTCDEIIHGTTGGCTACVDCACEDTTKCGFASMAGDSPTGFVWNLSIPQCAALGCACPTIDEAFYDLHGYPEDGSAFLFTACGGCAA